MITLLKLNLLDAKDHFIYTRNRDKSVELIKNLFKENILPIEYYYHNDLSDLEVEEIKSIIKKADVFSKQENYWINTPIQYGYTTVGTCVSGNIVSFTLGNNISNYPSKNDIIFNSIKITYNKAIVYPYVINNFNEFNTYYRVNIYDNLNLFINSLSNEIDGYYYINKNSYKREELLDFIDKLLGEQK